MANGTLEQIVKLSIQNRRPDLYRLLMKIGAKFRGFTEIEIRRVKRNQGLYPREATDFDRVEIYAEALKEGAVFPPILINEEDNLVDGNHRTESHIKADHERIWAERWEIPPHYLKLIAQAANTEAGKIDTPLTGKEKRRAIIQDWEDGIRDIELIAEALKTSVGYVKNVLSKAGLLKSRKEQMKEKARKLREEGLSYRQIAEKIKEEFGESVHHDTVREWCRICHTNDKSDTPDLFTLIEKGKELIDNGHSPASALNELGISQDEIELRKKLLNELIPYYNKLHCKINPEEKEKTQKPQKPIEEAENPPLVLQKWYWMRKWGATEDEAKAMVKLSEQDLEEGRDVNEKLYVELANQKRREDGVPELYLNPNWENEPHPYEVEREKERMEMNWADHLWERYLKDIEKLVNVLDDIAAVFHTFMMKTSEDPEFAKYVNDPELGGNWFVLKVLFKHLIDGDFDDTTPHIVRVLYEKNPERQQKIRDFLITLIEKGAERYLCPSCKTSLEDRKLHCKELVKKAAIKTLKAHGLKVEYYKDKHPYWFIKDILDKLED